MKLNLRSVDLNLLTVFEAIMDTGQLSRAGSQLGMSQPAMSAALQRLRHALHDDLFIRTSQGMVPTPRALGIHKSISQALEIIRVELQSGRVFDPSLCQRHFRILGGDYVEILFYGELINTIHREAPLVSSEVLPLLVSGFDSALKMGEIDVAVHYSKLDDEGINSQHVFDDRLVVVAREGHPNIRKRVTEKLFFNAGHVTLLSAEDNISHLELFLRRQKVDRIVVAQVTQFSSMVPVLLSTDNLCVMPESSRSGLRKPIRYGVTPCHFLHPYYPFIYCGRGASTQISRTRGFAVIWQT